MFVEEIALQADSLSRINSHLEQPSCSQHVSPCTAATADNVLQPACSRTCGRTPIRTQYRQPDALVQAPAGTHSQCVRGRCPLLDCPKKYRVNLAAIIATSSHHRMAAMLYCCFSLSSHSANTQLHDSGGIRRASTLDARPNLAHLHAGPTTLNCAK